MKRGRNTEYYNNKKDYKLSNRKLSPIYHLRSFNNWIKTVLICLYTKDDGSLRVLDLCGGKGGDLRKYQKRNCKSLVLVDGARNSVIDAEKRYSTFHGGSLKKSFPATFITADCFTTNIADKLDIFKFNLVSCQFALHYAFESKTKVKKALENISCRLETGGYFIGTVLDAYQIVNTCKKEGNTWGNKICTISFDDDFDIKNIPSFGAAFKFSLEGSVDQVTEYLVHFKILEKLALEYGLKLVYRATFHNFYKENRTNKKFKSLLYVMNILNKRTDKWMVSKDEYQVASLYVVFAFVKV